jgi:hypothetical protein
LRARIFGKYVAFDSAVRFTLTLIRASIAVTAWQISSSLT